MEDECCLPESLKFAEPPLGYCIRTWEGSIFWEGVESWVCYSRTVVQVQRA